MASAYKRMVAAGVFGLGFAVALAVYTVAAGRPMTSPELEFALQAYAFAALAAAVGFAAVGCRSVLRALCAIPIAVLLVSLIPRGLGIWLSQSFQSLALNLTVAGVLVAAVGAFAGWLVLLLFKLRASHA